ncbi:MAG: gliding motility-associated C-terminal domain-containing protein, partial [Saprospiraceae bacterium]
SVPFSIGSLKYSIIAGFYGDYNYFNRLSAGEYTIGVIDEYGCTFEQSFTMGVEDPISVDLGPDTIITLGQKVLIKPEFIVDSSDIIKVVWVNAPSDCGECLEFIDGPLKTTTYKIIIYNADGCIDEDEKQVFVNADDHLFVPNIFSPNGDGVNDILQISVNESVKLINSIKIFDRWGNNVYSANGLEPLPILDTWDGTMRGQKMNPAVFVYLVEYELVTGERLVKKGSVTIVR